MKKFFVTFKGALQNFKKNMAYDKNAIFRHRNDENPSLNQRFCRKNEFF